MKHFNGVFTVIYPDDCFHFGAHHGGCNYISHYSDRFIYCDYLHKKILFEPSKPFVGGIKKVDYKVLMPKGCPNLGFIQLEFF